MGREGSSEDATVGCMHTRMSMCTMLQPRGPTALCHVHASLRRTPPPASGTTAPRTSCGAASAPASWTTRTSSSCAASRSAHAAWVSQSHEGAARRPRLEAGDVGNGASSRQGQLPMAGSRNTAMVVGYASRWPAKPFRKQAALCAEELGGMRLTLQPGLTALLLCMCPWPCRTPSA